MASRTRISSLSLLYFSASTHCASKVFSCSPRAWVKSPTRVKLLSLALRRVSASLRRPASPVVPAASSSNARRSVGFASIKAATLPCATILADWAPDAMSAKSNLTSLARLSLPLMRNVDPEPRSIRREMTNSSASGKRDASSLPAVFRVNCASAKFRAGRVLVPEKMTSSMSSPRKRLALFSPMTQRNASTTLLLPQPFGPTTPVNPPSIINSVGSTKDLKPTSRSFENSTKRVILLGWASVRRALDLLGEERTKILAIAVTNAVAIYKNRWRRVDTAA